MLRKDKLVFEHAAQENNSVVVNKEVYGRFLSVYS